MTNDCNIASKTRTKLLKDAPGRLQNALTTLPRCLQAASSKPRDRKKADKMLQEASKMCETIPTTLPRQPNTPPNHAPGAYKRRQNVSKMR